MKLYAYGYRAFRTLLGAFCLFGVCSAQSIPARTPIAPPATTALLASHARPTAREIGDRLVDAIIQVESQGNPQCVGSTGERGLMQIRLTTWRETTRELFGRPLPFNQAFDPELNRRVGRAYLAHLQEHIAEHREHWRSDERSLLIAAYNAGPTCLRQKGFNLQRMPESTRDYVERVQNLHDAYLSTRTAQLRQQLATQVAAM